MPNPSWKISKIRSKCFICPATAELNPEERLNADMKQAIGKKGPVGTKAKLGAAANKHMTQLAQAPDGIKSYFQNQPVKYVA